MSDTERERLIAALKREPDEDSAEVIRARLRELIPATIEVWDVCAGEFAVVVAAPHVSFDGWTEYFCNRIAPALQSGRVIAKNFRDDDGHEVPVSIGRHIHVNRPTESRERGGEEFETELAQRVCDDYVRALRDSGGRSQLDLLIEVHGHHRHEQIEIATTGISDFEARRIRDMYLMKCADVELPQLLIEPLDKLYYTAESAKRKGSLRSDVTRCALHIEIPKPWRKDAVRRAELCGALCDVLKEYVARLKSGVIL
jgi:hypothetical protein